ncbi:MAG TPA: histidinol-phosphate transaminase [Thermoanaerobaculia bacterium]|nr:histidinol-phosphate transaminase [Thermoanaerobaculia bacterium]
MSSVRDVLATVRPEVRGRAAYRLPERAPRFRLDQNEVPWDLPPAAKRETLRRLAGQRWNGYPELQAESLRRDLAAFHGHPFEGILAGSGSGELLAAALDTLLGPGREALGIAPAFSLYGLLAERSGARLVTVGPRPDLRLPLDELLREVARDPSRPVLLASPNNPTGEAVEPDWVAELLGRLEAPLLLDNAYAEFCRFDYRPLLARHPQLMIFRTFSKAWSLAGLRVGYLLTSPELAREIEKVKLPYNVGHAAATAARVALAHAEEILGRVELLKRRREGFRAMLAARGFTVLPSEANFLLARVPDGDASAWHGALAERGLSVREPGLAGCLRVSIGTGAALRALERALDEILETWR